MSLQFRYIKPKDSQVEKNKREPDEWKRKVVIELDVHVMKRLIEGLQKMITSYEDTSTLQGDDLTIHDELVDIKKELKEIQRATRSLELI